MRMNRSLMLGATLFPKAAQVPRRGGASLQNDLHSVTYVRFLALKCYKGFIRPSFRVRLNVFDVAVVGQCPKDDGTKTSFEELPLWCPTLRRHPLYRMCLRTSQYLRALTGQRGNLFL